MSEATVWVWFIAPLHNSSTFKLAVLGLGGMSERRLLLDSAWRRSSSRILHSRRVWRYWNWQDGDRRMASGHEWRYLPQRWSRGSRRTTAAAEMRKHHTFNPWHPLGIFMLRESLLHDLLPKSPRTWALLPSLIFLRGFTAISMEDYVWSCFWR